MRSGLNMAWIHKKYTNIAKEATEAVNQQHSYYESLSIQIKKVRYTAKWVQEILGKETHILEKKLYFLRAKKIALEILGHCEHGSYLAVDDKIKTYYEGQKPGKHREVIQGYIDECRNLNNAVILKFPQVDEGIKHLENFLK